MTSKRNKSQKSNYLKKLSSPSLLSKLFSYIPKKSAIKILQYNKKISSLLNLTIGDYVLDKKYQEIIHNSNGNLNFIFLKSLDIYQNYVLDYERNRPEIPFTKIISNLIKYITFLSKKNKFKHLVLTFDANIYTNWMYFKYFIDIIRNIKCGLSLKINTAINYRYYEIIKDAIHDLKEINTITLYSFKKVKKDEQYIKDYFDIFDWINVKCLNFSGVIDYFDYKNDIEDIDIPDNSPFRKLILDDKCYFNARKLTGLIFKHSCHIEHLKIYNFNDKFFYEKGEKRLNKGIFQKLQNIQKIKFMNAQHLYLFSFLIFAKKILPSIKVLILDNICEYEKENYIYMQEHYNDMIKNANYLKNLEKFEINFNSNTTTHHAFQILSIIINNNLNIKDLKITIPEIKNENKELNLKKIRNLLEKFVNLDLSEINDDTLSKNEIEEFTNLIKAISNLKNLASLQLYVSMNDKMAKIFNKYFSGGETLNNLVIIHSNKLNLDQIFNLCPNLNKINLQLLKNENGNVNYNFKYDFPQRKWRSIELANYPLNNSLVDALIKNKNTINHLTVKDSVNKSSRSDVEFNNILLEIKNKINY